MPSTIGAPGQFDLDIDPNLLAEDEEKDAKKPEAAAAPDTKLDEQAMAATAKMNNLEFAKFTAEMGLEDTSPESINGLWEAYTKMGEATKTLVDVYEKDIFTDLGPDVTRARPAQSKEMSELITDYLKGQVKESVERSGRFDAKDNPITEIIEKAARFRQVQETIKQATSQLREVVGRNEKLKEEYAKLQAETEVNTRKYQNAELARRDAHLAHQQNETNLAELNTIIQKTQTHQLRTFNRWFKKGGYTKEDQVKLGAAKQQLEGKSAEYATMRKKENSFANQYQRQVFDAQKRMEAILKEGTQIRTNASELSNAIKNDLDQERTNLLSELGPLREARMVYDKVIQQEYNRLFASGDKADLSRAARLERSYANSNQRTEVTYGPNGEVIPTFRQAKEQEAAAEDELADRDQTESDELAVEVRAKINEAVGKYKPVQAEHAKFGKSLEGLLRNETTREAALTVMHELVGSLNSGNGSAKEAGQRMQIRHLIDKYER